MIKKIFLDILKSAGFLRAPEGSILMNMRQMTNFLYYAEVFSLLKNVEGSIVECGVGQGRSFLYFNYLSLREGKKRLVWGFDSFEGFPEPTPEGVSERNPKKGDWGYVRVRHIESVLSAAGIPKEWVRNQARLIKGFFTDSLVKYDGSPIALLHIDADLYESYKEVLERLYSKVASGGVVLFDEYDSPKWPGAKKAVDEFFSPLGLTPVKHIASGKHYIVKP